MAVRRNRELNILNNTSFLDAMANAVGALAFVLLMVVLVTVALKLNYLPLEIPVDRLPGGFVGQEYNIVLPALGGNQPYRWALKGTLPRGLDFDIEKRTGVDQFKRTQVIQSGRIHGIPREAGKTEFEVELRDTPVVDDKGKTTLAQEPVRKRFVLSVEPAPLPSTPVTIETRVLPIAVVGQEYGLYFAATGGVGPYVWEFKGAMPPGVVGQKDGRLVGAPTAPGDWTLEATVADRMGVRGRESRSLRFKAVRAGDDPAACCPHQRLRIVSDRIPDAIAGDSYGVVLAVIGGVPPYRWRAVGALPAGLRLTEDGRISGTAESGGQRTKFKVTVQNRADAALSEEDSRDLEMAIRPRPRPAETLRLF